MPGYPGGGHAQLLRTNSQLFLFNNELIVAGRSSIAVQLERISHSSYPFGAGFQVKFSGDPGAFEMDIQASDMDDDSYYVTVGSITSVNGGFSGRWDMTNLWPRFVRGQLVSITNAVNSTLLVTR